MHNEVQGGDDVVVFSLPNGNEVQVWRRSDGMGIMIRAQGPNSPSLSITPRLRYELSVGIVECKLAVKPRSRCG